MIIRVATGLALLAAATPAVAGGLVYDFTEFWKPRVGVTEPRFAPLAYDAAPLIDWGIPEAIRLEYEVDELAIDDDDWAKPEFDPLPYDFDELVSRAPRPRV
ncbi:MAG: hypothetical protein H7X93_12100 [Sphingomonadaceae bacterium]|nr:hypothetical protein [Sphingomonadaceae bacterium]